MNEFVATAEQREILEHRGPQLVLAGAGVGKTAVLTQRIADAIHRDAVPPERILALTFTRAAAEEMRQRIAQELERRELSADAQAIWAGTYHAFGAEVVREFGVRLGVPPTARLLGDAGKWDLLDRIFDELRLEAVLEAIDARTAGGVFKHILRFEREAQHLLLAPDQIKAWIDSVGARAASGQGRELLDQWMEMTAAYAALQQAKRAAGAIDYGDQISLAVRLLESFPDVADAMRARHTHLFVDEYQDTNPAQRRLLLSLAGQANPNLFVIGDDDQAIFRFQGATVRNILGLPHEPSLGEAPPSVKTLVLNRRSLAPILDLGNRIVGRIGDRHDKSLTAVRGDGEARMGAYTADTDLGEAQWIARRIGALRAAAPPGGARANPGAYAALCRTRGLMEPIVQALLAAGLPVQRAEPTPLLQRWEIDEVRAILQVLAAPDHDVALARVLLGPRWRIGDADLWALAQWRRARTQSDQPEQGPLTLSRTLQDSVFAADSIEELSRSARERLSRLARELESLALVARAAPVGALVRRIIDSGGYRRELAASPLADDAEALRNFDRLERLAAGIPADGLVGLRAFVTYLDRAEEAEDFDLGGTERPAPDPTAVTVTTVHRAKGLEWPVVFIPGLVEGKFPLKPHADRDRPDRVPYPLRAREAGLPPFPQAAFASDAELEAARSERDETLAALDLADERRLLYVAITRARDDLYFTRAYWYDDRKTPADPSSFWDEVVAHPAVEDLGTEDPSPSNPDRRRGVDQAESSEQAASVRAAVDLERRIAGGEADQVVRELLADVDDSEWAPARAEADDLIRRLAGRPSVPSRPQELFDLPISSYSALREFEACERRYRYIHVDRLPRRPRAAVAGGAALHRALAWAGLSAGDGETPDPTDLTGDLEAALADHPDLMEAYRSTRFAHRTAHAVELPFTLALETGVIRGVIDRIDLLPDGAFELVDFKTGARPSDAALARDLQLPIYALAVEDIYEAPPERIHASLLYLDGRDEWKLAWDRDRAGVFRARLNHLLQRLRDSKHPLTEDRARCVTCDFKHVCGR